MTKQIKSGQITRRRFVGGALAGGAVLTGIAAPAFAAAKSGAARLAAGKTGGDCRLRHAAMAEKLSRTIADPTVDAGATALAIRTSFCPCCGTQIGAGFHAEGVTA